MVENGFKICNNKKLVLIKKAFKMLACTAHSFEVHERNCRNWQTSIASRLDLSTKQCTVVFDASGDRSRLMLVLVKIKKYDWSAIKHG